ncbi:MAG: 6-carboxytetrahydropterin synthase QueD [Treponema sp.]|jgi:6-pyruvoyltetrahydropterin/6-carboxytetrahydropterin synthase|nr:6-carboxytetrahydropterin synthase QueD [Treponema sp.]
MYTIRITADFAAAHFLTHYHGKCENIHGHNYHVQVWFKGETLDKGGMLADFGAVKQCLTQVIAPLDHSNLNDVQDFAGDPSAERIARYIFDRVQATLPNFAVESGLLSAVDVFETPTNMARFENV